MAIDVQNETLIPFKDIPGWCAEHLGNRVHPTTIHRWRLRGARGVRLETLLAGGTRYSSIEALNRFFARVTAAADGQDHIVETDVINAKTISQAEAFLASEGF